MAISPRFAIRTFSNTAGEYCGNWVDRAGSPGHPLCGCLELALLAGPALVLAASTDAAVLALAADDLVLAPATTEAIFAGQAEDGVLSAEAGDHVRPTRAVDLVRPVVAHLRHLPAAAGLNRLPARIHFAGARRRNVGDVRLPRAVGVHLVYVGLGAGVHLVGDLRPVGRERRVAVLTGGRIRQVSLAGPVGVHDEDLGRRSFDA